MKATRLKTRFSVRYSMGIFLVSSTCVAAIGIESQVVAADATWSEQLVEASSVGNVQLREQLLQNPPADSEAQSLANALKGRLKDSDGQWVSIEESVQDDVRSNRIAEYERRRDSMEDTAENQWLLSQWCRKTHMPGRARAHALRVTELEGDHAAAHRYLGNVRVGDVWVDSDEAVKQQKELRETQQNLRVHSPKIRSIAEAFRSTDAGTKKKARRQFERVDTPDAIDAVLQQTFSGSNEFAMAAVNWLGEREEPKAAVALARLAVFDQRRGLRDQATQALKTIDPALFIPTMLKWCQGTIEAKHSLVFNERDRSYRIARQYRRQDAEGVKVLESVTDVIALATPAGVTGIVAKRDAVESLELESAADENLIRFQAEQFNEQSRRSQGRTAAVIQQLDPSFSDEVSAMGLTKWWNSYRGYNDTGVPPVERRLVRNTVYRTVGNSTPIGQVTNPAVSALRPRHECLVAGTMVWTDRGMRPIESLRTGDQVLSCDLNSGALSYRSVLHRTVRDPEPLMRMQMGSSELVASKGHPFWVVGRGWTAMEQIVPGDTLHGADGVAVVENMASAPSDKTYNLVVEQNHNYFVGKSQILSHDVEVERPNDVAMPGVTF